MGGWVNFWLALALLTVAAQFPVLALQPRILTGQLYVLPAEPRVLTRQLAAVRRNFAKMPVGAVLGDAMVDRTVIGDAVARPPIVETVLLAMGPAQMLAFARRHLTDDLAPFGRRHRLQSMVTVLEILVPRRLAIPTTLLFRRHVAEPFLRDPALPPTSIRPPAGAA